MTRVLVFAEGQTEETFVRDVLVPYFAPQGIYLTPILAQTSPGYKGGIPSYAKVKPQIVRLCRQDRGATITTMIDYYGLPTDFPGYTGGPHPDGPARASWMETELQRDINEPNFLPYIQLHEFEALLFSEPCKFAAWIDDEGPIAALEAIQAEFGNPELINNDPNTAPSKRILAAVPEYRKTLHGPLIAADIGLDSLREQCPRFNQWLTNIAQLSVA